MVNERLEPGRHAVGPDIPLSQHDLLVNARGEPHLAAELKKELASANRVDLIVAFVRWYGVRLVVDELEDAIRRGARIRLLTTTYTGSTEAGALERLRDIGVAVRVSYDTQITRLHAKAWVFHRRSGYSTAWMLLINLWGLRQAPSDPDVAWQALWDADALRQELLETLPLLRERIARPSLELDAADVPVRLHASYTRDELLAAFGHVTADRRPNLQAGHWHDDATSTELLLITLQKASGYSPSTQYRDHAISRELFHWESPNNTRADSRVGRRFVEQRENGMRVLLAVRSARNDAWGSTRAYTLLGPADLVSFTGERPMAITWRLRNPIPADLYEGFKLAA